MVITVCSTQAVACCPLCQSRTGRVHSRYVRTLKDLSLDQFGLTIVLEVCKFFCLNGACRRRIFTERLPTLVAPWASRNTFLRLIDCLSLPEKAPPAHF